jgi:ATP-dependent exoDNAse (exonuclease V) beta subunit
LKEDILKKLQCFEDENFIFDPIKHKYTYLGEEFTSVTKFISRFHKPFDTDYHANKKAEKEGIPVEWVKEEWNRINKYSLDLGSETHNWIEDYFNQKWRPLPTNPDVINRINKFNIIYGEHLHKLEPLKFEVRVFSKKWKIAGMIDALFMYRGKIYIVDYKTNKQFITDDNMIYTEKLLYPFNSFYKNHLNEYSIQISMYAAILGEWGFNVAGGYLVHIGPGDEPAKIYKCLNMVPLLSEYLDGGGPEK